MSLIHVSVTQHDIDNADGQHDMDCMVYRALKRALPANQFRMGIYDVWFLRNGSHWSDNIADKFIFVKLPEDIKRRIHEHYDNIYTDGPFEFDLEVPDKVLEASCQK